MPEMNDFYMNNNAIGLHSSKAKFTQFSKNINCGILQF